MPRARKQPIRVATGQTYGEAGAQRAAQKAIPLPQVPAPPVAGPPPVGGTAGGPGVAAQPAPGPPLGSAGPLDAPTANPNEPITAGLPTGAGGGPITQPDYNSELTRLMYLANPTPANADLVAELNVKSR